MRRASLAAVSILALVVGLLLAGVTPTSATTTSTTWQTPGLVGSGFAQTLHWDFRGLPAATTCVRDLKHGVPACIDPTPKFSDVSWNSYGARFTSVSCTPAAGDCATAPAGRLDVAPSPTLTQYAYPGSHNWYISFELYATSDTSANIVEDGLTKTDPTDPTGVRNLAFVKLQFNSCVMIGTDGQATSVYSPLNLSRQHFVETCEAYNGTLYFIINGRVEAAKRINGNGIITDAEHFGLGIGSKLNPKDQPVDSTDCLFGTVARVAFGVGL